jgi:hypothetical protein
MYLPTLLVRDAGKAGFLAFLIPNAIGAASVGWVLAGRADRFLQTKKPIILAFTAVTIAFHGYWIAWMAGNRIVEFPAEFLGGLVFGASVVGNAIAIAGKPRGFAAVVTLFFSLLAAAGLLAFPADAPWLSDSPLDLAGLAAVCVLGFGLCPYLDLTFNKATIESRRPRLIFTLGFLVFAAALTMFTRGRVLWSEASPVAFSLDIWTFMILLGAHFGAQTTFTIAAHAEAVQTTLRTRLRSFSGLWLTLLPALLGLAIGVAITTIDLTLGPVSIFEVSLREAGYRSFLAAYGLVFPAWLLLSLGGRDPMARRTLTVLGVTCLLALPFFAYGFLALKQAWILPGIAIVLIAPAFNRRAMGR